MNLLDISNTEDPDLRSSLTALRRASMVARKTAIQTDTELVVVVDGRLVFIDAQTLRRQAENSDASTS